MASIFVTRVGDNHFVGIGNRYRLVNSVDEAVRFTKALGTILCRPAFFYDYEGTGRVVERYDYDVHYPFIFAHSAAVGMFNTFIPEAKDRTRLILHDGLPFSRTNYYSVPPDDFMKKYANHPKMKRYLDRIKNARGLPW